MTTRDIAPNRPTSLRAGNELEVEFTDILANGQAVGRADGVAVFCFGPLPGERARVSITSVKRRYAVATEIERLSDSPARAVPFCPVFGRCGGCQVQHLGYPAQLRWKRDVVANALQRIGGLGAISVNETIGMRDPRAYRNKMSLVVDHHGPEPKVGFYRQRSHDVVPIDACPIAVPQLSEYVTRFAAMTSDDRLRGFFGDARHLVARAARATGDAVVAVTTAQPSKPVEASAERLLHELPGLRGVTNSYDLTSENAILGRVNRVVAGDAEIEERIGGVRYRISAASFFQVNAEMVAQIFAYLEPWLEPARDVLDLYCGVGTFSVLFAAHGSRVCGVEESAGAIAEAEANARLNGLDALTRFETGRVEECLREGAPLRAALETAALVFLDPPRKGSDELTLGAIAAARVPDVLYLSCDPATLARDSKLLVAKGYRIADVQPFDMFPQTGHVEALVHFGVQ